LKAEKREFAEDERRSDWDQGILDVSIFRSYTRLTYQDLVSAQARIRLREERPDLRSAAGCLDLKRVMT